MASWHIAQLNVGRLRAPLDDPQLAGFTGNLDRINALADAAPGFVWRLVGSGNNATDILPTDDPLFLINMSVWRDIQSLFDFTYRTAHTEIMARRRDFFEPHVQPHQALWWVPAGDLPDIEMATSRLAHLRTHGPTATAFTFKQVFPVPA